MKEAAKCPTQIANNELTNSIYHRLASLMASARDEPLKAGLTNYTQLNSTAYVQAVEALKNKGGYLQQSKLVAIPRLITLSPLLLLGPIRHFEQPSVCQLFKSCTAWCSDSRPLLNSS
uniref:Uncharacterized protein n=1 Tax=Ditylenchus dipsaci TaxID=166011 RepID=A0A915DV04_9BILA